MKQIMTNCFPAYLVKDVCKKVLGQELDRAQPDPEADTVTSVLSSQ